MKISGVLQQVTGAICAAIQSATEERRGSEGSLSRGTIMEVVSPLCLEREASLRGDQEGRYHGQAQRQESSILLREQRGEGWLPGLM